METYTCNPSKGPLLPICIYTLAYDLYQCHVTRLVYLKEYARINPKQNDLFFGYEDQFREIISLIDEHQNDLKVCAKLVKELRQEQGIKD